MFKIEKSSNRISRLEKKRFSELGFSERNHLQEWLANQPDALGEELLIIQKEFDGFDDTRERLDLLALDKEGNLVIIENKLDDSGRDVVWQAIKYASYCASLTKQQVLDIFQAYLDANSLLGGVEFLDANSLVCEFLDVSDLSEVVINPGNEQRIIWVAANYRKEVTSTALWLLQHGIRLQCFKVSPYAMSFGTNGDVQQELFLNVEQIIPTPEAKELMISMSAKEADEKVTKSKQKRGQAFNKSFWESALDKLYDSDCTLFDNVSASKESWIAAGSGISSCNYILTFSKKEVRMELFLGRKSKEENKAIFDSLVAKKSHFEHCYGSALDWVRSDNKKGSKVQMRKEFNVPDIDCWPTIFNWYIDNAIKMENTI